MNPSYCRIRVPKDAALQRFARWSGLEAVGTLVATNCMKAIELATDNGTWRGAAVFIAEVGGWTLIQDLSGCLSATPGEDWLRFAETDDLIFAAYNDAIGYGELVVIEGGTLRREFLYDSDSPEDNVDVGALSPDAEPLRTWIEVASFVDDDDLGFAEEGWLWVFHPRAGSDNR